VASEVGGEESGYGDVFWEWVGRDGLGNGLDFGGSCARLQPTKY